MTLTLSKQEQLELARKYADGNLSAKRESLWNPAGIWPSDFNDREQNPHRRPLDYWVGMVGGHVIGWEGVVGWSTRQAALDAASKFREKCREKLEAEEQERAFAEAERQIQTGGF